MIDKTELRRRMCGVRQAISGEEQRRQAEAVTAAVLAWPVFQQADSVLLYAAMPQELDTGALLSATLAAGKRLLLPRCGAAGQMDAVEISDLRRLRPGTWSILEPPPEWPAADPAGIGLALIPGVAFDAYGHRLGHGAGYYDRFLQRTAATTAGLALREQLVAAVPCEPHDVPLHYIITGAGITPARQEV